MIVHPNVVRTLDFGVSTRGEQFVVMEFIDGKSFRAVRELRSARSWRTSWNFSPRRRTASRPVTHRE